MPKISDFEARATDWRGQIRKNKRRTRWVIFCFVAMYVFIGLLADAMLQTSTQAVYQSTGPYAGYYIHQADYVRTCIQLITFQKFPFITLILAAIAIISLWITYLLYDKIMLMGTEYHEISDKSHDPTERQLFNIMDELKVAAGMQYMPRIFIIEAYYMNAFASGYSEKSAMVAITRGLLEKLTRAEVQAVMAHELSHIRHLDIKLTLTVAVLSNIMLIVVDMLFFSVLYNRRRGENPIAVVIILLRYLLPVFTVILSLFLSRTREYMADAGSVELLRDNTPMGSALLKIHQDHQAHAHDYAHEYAATPHEDVRRASYLYDPVKAGVERASSFSGLFSTHPSTMDRLKAIGFKIKK